MPKGVNIVSQGAIVAKSLAKYLESHPDLAQKCSQSGQLSFYTTDNPQAFELQASTFLEKKLQQNIQI